MEIDEKKKNSKIYSQGQIYFQNGRLRPQNSFFYKSKKNTGNIG